MEEFELPGKFYLGRRYDPDTRETTLENLLYDSRDLVTHGVCVGMTGSGKTGLCIDLLEEAALDDIPSIIIDPKGDITNLLLLFPELRPEDFRPWINPEDARRKGLTPDEYAVKIADTWRNGLAKWGEGPDRIKRLRESADFLVYTPGSDAGFPVSILQTLKAPSLSWDTEAENLRAKITGTVSALLGLIGIQADPVRSREHILLANIFEHAWKAGEDLDLAKLILAVQNPPMRQLGVFDVEAFFPQKDRFELAMSLNSILAAPSFRAWIEGTPLDIPAITRGPSGKPRAAVFYIAHLSDAERMFFVTLLLQQVLSWMYSQPGTNALRMLIYFDEVFGYFPPVAEPPSKKPLLTLLKQGRAFGVGTLLTTQNPVDIDYKGLTNAGTWFIGKLQTERDKNRLMEGLQGASAEAGSPLDADRINQLISSLDSRVFLIHNVHAEGPELFKTRWAMSYLRGPLTKPQVRDLMRPVKKTLAASAVAGTATQGVISAVTAPPSPEPTVPAGLRTQPPTLSSRIEQYFLPVALSEDQALREAKRRSRGGALRNSYIVYEPMLFGLATVRFDDRKRNVDTTQVFRGLWEVPDVGIEPEWEEGETLDLDRRDVETAPPREGRDGGPYFADLPEALAKVRSLSRLRSDWQDYLYRNAVVEVPYNPTLKIYGSPDDRDRDFRRRCEDAARAERDKAIKKQEAKFQKQLDRLQDKLDREKQELVEDKLEYEGRKREEALSAGESVLGFLLGRRSSRAISTASRKRRLTEQAKADVEESEEMIAKLEREIEELRQEMKDELDQISEYWSDVVEQVEKVEVAPKKRDIDIDLFGVGWAPVWEFVFEDERGLTDHVRVPAYGGSAGP